MTGDNFREALKWSVFAAVIIALWCGVIAVRKAQAAIASDPRISAIQMERTPSEDIHPVWVILVYEVQDERSIGITVFVFESYEECHISSAQITEQLGLTRKPACILRWMKEENVSKGSMM